MLRYIARLVRLSSIIILVNIFIQPISAKDIENKEKIKAFLDCSGFGGSIDYENNYNAKELQKIFPSLDGEYYKEVIADENKIGLECLESVIASFFTVEELDGQINFWKSDLGEKAKKAYLDFTKLTMENMSYPNSILYNNMLLLLGFSNQLSCPVSLNAPKEKQLLAKNILYSSSFDKYVLKRICLEYGKLSYRKNEQEMLNFYEICYIKALCSNMNEKELTALAEKQNIENIKACWELNLAIFNQMVKENIGDKLKNKVISIIADNLLGLPKNDKKDDASSAFKKDIKDSKILKSLPDELSALVKINIKDVVENFPELNALLKKELNFNKVIENNDVSNLYIGLDNIGDIINNPQNGIKNFLMAASFEKTISLKNTIDNLCKGTTDSDKFVKHKKVIGADVWFLNIQLTQFGDIKYGFTQLSDKVILIGSEKLLLESIGLSKDSGKGIKSFGRNKRKAELIKQVSPKSDFWIIADISPPDVDKIYKRLAFQRVVLNAAIQDSNIEICTNAYSDTVKNNILSVLKLKNILKTIKFLLGTDKFSFSIKAVSSCELEYKININIQKLSVFIQKIAANIQKEKNESQTDFQKFCDDKLGQDIDRNKPYLKKTFIEASKYVPVEMVGTQLQTIGKKVSLEELLKKIINSSDPGEVLKHLDSMFADFDNLSFYTFINNKFYFKKTDMYKAIFYQDGGLTTYFKDGEYYWENQDGKQPKKVRKTEKIEEVKDIFTGMYTLLTIPVFSLKEMKLSDNIYSINNIKCFMISGVGKERWTDEPNYNNIYISIDSCLPVMQEKIIQKYPDEKHIYVFLEYKNCNGLTIPFQQASIDVRKGKIVDNSISILRFNKLKINEELPDKIFSLGKQK